MGCSVVFAGASVEEEVEGVRGVVEAVVRELELVREGKEGMVNGVGP